ncbi:protein Ups1p, mitochondrial [Trichomonascus vanleenenianus]|uniref:Ups1p n=1 Tax=Trichomonascus vanleenenianus TaxID=2268995 RepID=UPI003ECB9934
MVLAYTSTHQYDYDFATTSLAHYNKYPNPFSSHVASADTVSQYIDKFNRLHTERLIRKKGRLPAFIKPFLGKISESWVLETTIVDPTNAKMESWTRNLDHTAVLKVDEFTVYQADSLRATCTRAHNNVSFVSNFGWGVREKIENWSYKRFMKNIQQSRKGMSFVMEHLREKGIKAFRQMQLSTAKSAIN